MLAITGKGSCLPAGLSSFFAAEGKLIARYPWTTILLCAAVTALCMIGFLKFEVEQDADTLYTPNDAEVSPAIMYMLMLLPSC